MINIVNFLLLNLLVATVSSWPLPYERVRSRPVNDPFCQAEVAFCPTGKTTDSLPVMDESDLIEVFALKKPVWQSKIGPFFKYFNVWHDGLGFRNTITNLEYTMEWYELDQLFNSTFAHVIKNESLTWCNQGALCSFDGINHSDWTEYGLFEKVADINGSVFNRFANWSKLDNDTAVFYETWTVVDSTDLGSQTVWFDSFDCANWVLRAFQKIYDFGGRFNHSVKLNYTKLNLYGSEPVLLGNYSQIMNTPNLNSSVLEFYWHFQKRADYFTQAIEIFNQFLNKKVFYFYYNSLYWYIPLVEPYVKFTFNEIPLPGAFDYQLNSDNLKPEIN